jgi:nitrogen fixation protein FixH
MTRNFTGRHMAAILVTFFAVVFAVNFLMARFASSTFGGVVVENSYVASQNYNRWLGEARAQERLGWSAAAARIEGGRVRVTVLGPGQGVSVRALARHPLGRKPDRDLAFEPAGDGAFVSREALPAGRWRLHLELREGEATWRQENDLP